MKEEHPKFQIIYDDPHTSMAIWEGDATDEELKEIIIDQLIGGRAIWLSEQGLSYTNPNPHEWTDEEQKAWDANYYDCHVYAVMYDPSVPETSKYSCGDGYVYYDVLTYEDEKEWGLLDYEDYCAEYDRRMKERKTADEISSTD